MIERRAVRRYELCLQMVVRVTASGSVSSRAAQTRQVSTKAVYFMFEHALIPGDVISFTLTAPLTHDVVLLLSGGAKVCRVHRDSDGNFGIAAAIERYEVSRLKNEPNAWDTLRISS